MEIRLDGGYIVERGTATAPVRLRLWDTPPTGISCVMDFGLRGTEGLIDLLRKQMAQAQAEAEDSAL